MNLPTGLPEGVLVCSLLRNWGSTVWLALGSWGDLKLSDDEELTRERGEGSFISFLCDCTWGTLWYETEGAFVNKLASSNTLNDSAPIFDWCLLLVLIPETFLLQSCGIMLMAFLWPNGLIETILAYKITIVLTLIHYEVDL